MTETAWLDATAQAELVRRGEISAADLVDAAIGRIEAVNPMLDAVIRTRFDQARAEARGESGTLMACTPRAASMPAPSISLEQSMPLGGTTSTRVTNFFAAIREPSFER